MKILNLTDSQTNIEAKLTALEAEGKDVEIVILETYQIGFWRVVAVIRGGDQ